MSFNALGIGMFLGMTKFNYIILINYSLEFGIIRFFVIIVKIILQILFFFKNIIMNVILKISKIKLTKYISVQQYMYIVNFRF
jgi:hypothetical protein